MAEKVLCEIVVDDAATRGSYFNVLTVGKTRRSYYGGYDSLVEAMKELPFDHFRFQLDILQEENAALQEELVIAKKRGDPYQ